jgi:AMMECR1 domain-containing protein
VKTQDGKNAEPPFALSESEKSELLSVARKSVEEAVAEKKEFEPGPTGSEALNQDRGAFVTLLESGDLRGCIGYTSATKPLYLTVRDTATFAALRDPRFRPVSAPEVGQDGLLMKNGEHEGLLLPQVPVEQKWDRQKFLEETCGKAGMRATCWQDADTDIFAFTAVVFGEHKP